MAFWHRLVSWPLCGVLSLPTLLALMIWREGLRACGLNLDARDCKLKGESVPGWPFFRSQEYLDRGDCRKKESHLTFFSRHRHIELLKSKFILLYCLIRTLISWTQRSEFLHSPHANLKASSVCSFRTVADIRNLVLYSSKRSLIVATSEGIDLGSYV